MSEPADLFAEAVAAAMSTVPKGASEDGVATSGEFEGVPADPLEQPALTTPEAEKAPVEAPKAPEATPPADRSSPVTNDKFAPRFAKLMERETAIVAREQALKAAEAELAAVKTQAAELATAQARFKADPISYIRKFAPDMKPAELAKLLWYGDLGEAAPIEHRVSQTERAAKQTMEELRAEIEQERRAAAEATQNAAMEAAHNQYVGALSAIAKSVPDVYPLVKAFSQQDPERVTRGLYRMAQKHARATNGEVATPEQCAEMLQKELSSLQPVFGGSAAPTPAPKPVESPSSLRNKHSVIQPNKTDAMSEDERFNEALEAARAVASRMAT